MPDLREIIDKKVSRLEAIPDKFLSAVEKTEATIYAEITTLLDAIKTDKAGNIIRSKANLTAIEEVILKLKKVAFGKDYTDSLVAFARQFNTQKEINDEYFTKAFPDYVPSEVAGEIVKISQKNTVALLSGQSVDSAFFNPIKQQMINAVASGASRVDMINAIRQVALGDAQSDGRLLSYAKQIAHDAFALSDRTYTSMVADDLGVEWFFYSGSKIPTSREFCVARHEKYYHKKEVESWGSLKWDGKMAGTNSKTIFSTAGGYQCRHSIIPVSISVVPPSVVKRNENNGNYKP